MIHRLVQPFGCGEFNVFFSCSDVFSWSFGRSTLNKPPCFHGLWTPPKKPQGSRDHHAEKDVTKTPPGKQHEEIQKLQTFRGFETVNGSPLVSWPAVCFVFASFPTSTRWAPTNDKRTYGPRHYKWVAAVRTPRKGGVIGPYWELDPGAHLVAMPGAGAFPDSIWLKLPKLFWLVSPPPPSPKFDE